MEKYKGFTIVYVDGEEEDYLVNGGVTAYEIEIKFSSKTFTWIENKFINVNQVKHVKLIQ